MRPSVSRSIRENLRNSFSIMITIFFVLRLLSAWQENDVACSPTASPRGSLHITIKELGPQIPYYRRNYGSQFPNGCICGPSGPCMLQKVSKHSPNGQAELQTADYGRWACGSKHLDLSTLCNAALTLKPKP